MNNLASDSQQEYEKKYRNFKKLIRNLRRNKSDKINSKKADNNIQKR